MHTHEQHYVHILVSRTHSRRTHTRKALRAYILFKHVCVKSTTAHFSRMHTRTHTCIHDARICFPRTQTRTHARIHDARIFFSRMHTSIYCARTFFSRMYVRTHTWVHDVHMVLRCWILLRNFVVPLNVSAHEKTLGRKTAASRLTYEQSGHMKRNIQQDSICSCSSRILLPCGAPMEMSCHESFWNVMCTVRHRHCGQERAYHVHGKWKRQMKQNRHNDRSRKIIINTLSMYKMTRRHIPISHGCSVISSDSSFCFGSSDNCIELPSCLPSTENSSGLLLFCRWSVPAVQFLFPASVPALLLRLLALDTFSHNFGACLSSAALMCAAWKLSLEGRLVFSTLALASSSAALKCAAWKSGPRRPLLLAVTGSMFCLYKEPVSESFKT